MVTYTIEYCKENGIYIHCPTLEIFKKVTKLYKVASIIRTNYWKHYNKNTHVGFIKMYKGGYEPCYDGVNLNNIQIPHEIFFKDNNINTIYELW